MSFAAIANSIRSHFNTEFTQARPTVPILWDNVKRSSEASPDQAWVRFSISEKEPTIRSFGAQDARRVDTPGIAVVEIFTPVGDGDGLLREIADTVSSIFNLRSVDNIQFYETRLIPMGQEGPFYRGVVLTDYVADVFA